MKLKPRNPLVAIAHKRKAGRHTDKRKDTVMENEIGIYEVTITYTLRVPAGSKEEAIDSARDMIADMEPVPKCSAKVVDKA